MVRDISQILFDWIEKKRSALVSFGRLERREKKDHHKRSFNRNNLLDKKIEHLIVVNFLLSFKDIIDFS